MHSTQFLISQLILPSTGHSGAPTTLSTSTPVLSSSCPPILQSSPPASLSSVLPSKHHHCNCLLDGAEDDDDDHDVDEDEDDWEDLHGCQRLVGALDLWDSGQLSTSVPGPPLGRLWAASGRRGPLPLLLGPDATQRSRQHWPPWSFLITKGVSMLRLSLIWCHM